MSTQGHHAAVHRYVDPFGFTLRLSGQRILNAGGQVGGNGQGLESNVVNDADHPFERACHTSKSPLAHHSRIEPLMLLHLLVDFAEG